MRRELRVVLVAALTAVLVIDPATACHYYGYGWGYSQPCGGYCEPVSCCGCGGYEVVDSGPCGCDGEVVSDGPPHDAAPSRMQEPGGEQPPLHSGPANVHRPVDRMPAPRLQPEPTPPQTQPVQPSRDEPVAEEVAPPSSPSADELFGPPSVPAVDPDNDMFGPAETPVTPPADEPPATEDTDDRYPPPSEEPSEPSADDMFGPAPDEPMDEPAEEPADEPAEDDFSFGAPPDESTPPAEEEPMEEEEEPAPPAEGEQDDLFNFGAVLREPGGFASAELRSWVDNTGRYSCRGRLIRVLDAKVQLLKENGRTTSVPFGRLSQNDLQFVHRQASAQRAEVVGQTAQVGPPQRAQ